MVPIIPAQREYKKKSNSSLNSQIKRKKETTTNKRKSIISVRFMGQVGLRSPPVANIRLTPVEPGDKLN